ncbi:hypothetical protein LJK88_10590 [Paenibacillus sp. P26]|nr:hypothetical protein LJK88_10590 [Paenibacillus sp. P26]
MRLKKPWIAAVAAIVVLGGAGTYYVMSKPKAKSARDRHGNDRHGHEGKYPFHDLGNLPI